VKVTEIIAQTLRGFEPSEYEGIPALQAAWRERAAQAVTEALGLVEEWRVGRTEDALEGGGSTAPYTFCERDEARARLLFERPQYDRLETRPVGDWKERTDV
jgi:hypothetical protein